MNTFYVVNSKPDGDRIPYFFELIWAPELPVFDLPAASPSVNDFAIKYRIRAKTDVLNVDVLIDYFIATDKFLSVCQSLGVKYISVPAEIELDGATGAEKQYNFFCVTERQSVLNQDESDFRLMDDRLLRPLAERGPLPVYDRIDKFVMLHDVEEHLFYCEEIKQLVCSSRFKFEFEQRNLIGLNFIVLDENYIYAPWDDF